MSNRFDNIPHDKDTKTLFSKEIKVDDYEVVHEKWNWEGIKAESFIFLTEDIKELTEEDLKNLVVNSGKWNYESQILVKQSESGYTFVNFNYKY